MALFEVPGWSVPSAPVSNSAQHPRKRKRPNTEQVRAAEVNVERLVKKLGAGTGNGKDKAAQRMKKPRHEDKARAHPAEKEKQKSGPRRDGKEKGGTAKGSKSPRQSGDTARSDSGKASTAGEPGSSSAPKPAKKSGRKDAAASAVDSSKKSTLQQSASNLNSLQSGMKHSLDGARFRWINETLYKSDSADAHAMMREDRAVFHEYHKGFRHQVESWPSNPVSHYTQVLSSYPPKTVIADLGCGEAALARALIPKGFTVLSFDLVSDGPFIIEADIFGKLPLPGSESSEEGDETVEGCGQVVDVVVCALSLMGTNWPKCMREAWRILRPGGELKIAEVASRIADNDEFASYLASFGFRLESIDDRNSHLTLFEFKKIARKPLGEKEWQRILSQGHILKPCEYKRR
ncbi:hypothetical protein EVG20_g3067 [Dentipellis fragilis]|uniref:Ribosomal RNA-processing protein 8 n=1 Tax=Dentipellis fragilis TaxID=205917 RepID=A0A4Y9Z4K4_9AGAM|nr:hypothetical protein EVG20_g3067 [Dentipellis fragilis]